MEERLIRITPNKERAKSIEKMAETTLDLIKSIDEKKFPSNILKEYYDVIRELMAALLLLDGYKIEGEGAHKKLIEYILGHYREFSGYEITLLDDMRNKRNKIAYEGFFITEDYLSRHKATILGIVDKLKEILKKKI